MGVSCDSHNSHRAWSNALGNIRYPMLSDFHPHGAMVKAYGLFNESNGAPKRSVIIVDKQGVVRFRQEYAPGTQPNPTDILAELDKIK
ncbi:MAG: redoxin domain-containing protein [SAR202 cluster bacterium]|nr:redoxin domain-containing protein [SAR202 cluster bacterium]